MITLLELTKEIVILKTSTLEPFEDDSFNRLLREIQKLIGVESGDFASMYFDSGSESVWITGDVDSRVSLITRYIAREVKVEMCYSLTS